MLCLSVLWPLQVDFAASINFGPPSKWCLAGGPMVARFLYAYLIMAEQGSRYSCSKSCRYGQPSAVSTVNPFKPNELAYRYQ